MPGKWSPRLVLNSAPASASRLSTKARIGGGVELGPTREEKHFTVRTRKASGARDLPLPPALDPVVKKQRWQWEEPKARPDYDHLTSFQEKLAKNPYAHIIASPVRQCRTTQVPLPVKLLTTLHARPHPTTKVPWLLPISLTADDQKPTGASYYCPLRQYAIEYLGKKRRWERGVNARITNMLGQSALSKMVWREGMPEFILDLMRKKTLGKLKWYFGIKRQLTPVASPRTQDIDKVDDVGCILFVDSLRTRADDVHDRAVDIAMEMEKWSSYVAKSFKDSLDPHTKPGVTHHSPAWYTEPVVPRLQPRALFPELEFPTTTWRGKQVPVYSLTDLLGEENTKELLQGSKYKRFGCLIIRELRHNVTVQILLMQLQAYLARPGP